MTVLRIIERSATVIACSLLVCGFLHAKDRITARSLHPSLANKRSTVQKTSHSPSKNFFEDDRIRVAIPAGWSARTTTETVTGDRTYELPIGALFTRGRYRLYLLTHYDQASGIVGGRFAEVAKYVSPWIDMSDLPWLACPGEIQNSDIPVNRDLFRRDLYFDTRRATKKALADCGSPWVKGTLWYGSYFSETCPDHCGGGFFLSYQALAAKPSQNGVFNTQPSMVFTLTYETKTPNELPRKGDPELLRVLQEASRIVGSIVYK